MSQTSAMSAAASADGTYEPPIPTHDSDRARWFSEEIQPHEPALRAYLRSRFPTLEDVDDHVQETYARLFRARESGRRGLNRGYLFVVARNAVIDLFRRKQAVPFVGLAAIESLAVAEDQPNSAEALNREQELELLEAAVNALPDRCREIFTLRRLHNRSHQEIARMLGIAENTVNAQLVIGMTRCRQFIRDRQSQKHRPYANART
jgi:RNA polymerase sigma factor (sigma-70 family)